jgi:hypothetical protein
MELDALADMHLLLREHGWEPDNTYDKMWWWTLPGCASQIVTYSEPKPGASESREGKRQRRYRTVAALRLRLEQLSPRK